MIINHTDKWIYLATAKTGTRSMIAWLNEHWTCEQTGGYASHDTKIPADLRHYFTFTTIRDPYQRAVSFWWSTVIRDEGKKYALRRLCEKTYGDHSLESLMKLLVDSPREGEFRLGHHGSLSQVEFLGHNRIDLTLRTESFPDCLLRLPFCRPVQAETLQHKNRSADDVGYKHWEEFLTPRIVHLIGQWAYDDFARFGYAFRRRCLYERSGGLK